MKTKVVYILIGVLFAWNVLLSIRPTTETIIPNNDHAIFDSLYHRHDDKLNKIESELKLIDPAISRDSIFVHNANRKTRDSLRLILNPR